MLWTKAMEGGIPAIDEQHKELFRQVDYLLNSEDPERVPDTLEFLKDYVIRHFATEEVLHNQTNYPGRMVHKKIHDNFIATFQKLKEEYNSSGYNLTILLKVNQTAVAWLKEHVMGEDMKFAEYYKKTSGVAS